MAYSTAESGATAAPAQPGGTCSPAAQNHCDGNHSQSAYHAVVVSLAPDLAQSTCVVATMAYTTQGIHVGIVIRLDDAVYLCRNVESSRGKLELGFIPVTAQTATSPLSTLSAAGAATTTDGPIGGTAPAGTTRQRRPA